MKCVSSNADVKSISLSMRKDERHMLDKVETKYLRSMRGMTKMIRWRVRKWGGEFVQEKKSVS